MTTQQKKTEYVAVYADSTHRVRIAPVAAPARDAASLLTMYDCDNVEMEIRRFAVHDAAHVCAWLEKHHRMPPPLHTAYTGGESPTLIQWLSQSVVKSLERALRRYEECLRTPVKARRKPATRACPSTPGPAHRTRARRLVM